MTDLKAWRLEETEEQGQTIELEDTERIKKEKEACKRKGVKYPDTFENQQEREFWYFVSLFPETYYCWIDQVWRMLDERDGMEYIMYHAYHYCKQTIKGEAGKTIERNHNIDLYHGFWEDPQVTAQEFNPNGSVAKQRIEGAAKVYDIPWSKETFDKIIDDPKNRGTVTQFALGIAPVDGSRIVPLASTTQAIRNREDFSEYDYDKTMELGKSQLSTTGPSMAQIQKTLALRKKLMEAKPTEGATSPPQPHQQVSTSSSSKQQK